jgi:CheY-like chemotaxis protein
VEAVWIALIVIVGFLVLVLIFSSRFPDLIRRTKELEMTPTRVAWTFFEEAVRTKEHREPDRAGITPTLERIKGGQILWVDDAPINNHLEVEALRALGVEVDQAVSNGEALEYLQRKPYHAVLSDIGRRPPERPEAGLDLPALLREKNLHAPLAFYTGHAAAPVAPSGEPVFDSPTALLAYLADRLDTRRSERSAS